MLFRGFTRYSFFRVFGVQKYEKSGYLLRRDTKNPPPRPDKQMIDRMLYFSDGTVLFVFADAFLRPAAGREAERRRSAR